MKTIKQEKQLLEKKGVILNKIAKRALCWNSTGQRNKGISMRWPGGKSLKAESMVLRILEKSQEATMIGAESVKGWDDMTEGTVYHGKS